MDLTPENKTYIDSLNYEALLRSWRLSPAGNPWFQGETGVYWGAQMAKLRAADQAGAVAASKRIGWEK